MCRVALGLAALLVVLSGCGGHVSKQLPADGAAFATLPGTHVAQLLEDSSGRVLALGIDDASRAFVARLGRDGSIDTTFGTGGAVRWPYSRFLGWNAGALLPDGRIILAGSTRFGTADTQSILVLTALGRDGRIDQSFGHQGYTVTTQKSCLRGPTGIAAAGNRILVSIVRICNAQSGQSIVLMRFDGRGRPDSAFGSGAPVALSAFPGTVTPSAPIVLLPKNRIAVALVGAAPGRIDVVRLLDNGSRDPRFGTGGIATGLVNVDSLAVYVQALFAAKVDRLTVAGCTDAGPFWLRFNRNGTPYRFWGGGPVGSSVNVEHFGGAFGSRCAAFAQLRTHELVAAGAGLARIYASGFVEAHKGLLPLPVFEPFARVPTHVVLAASDGSIFVASRVRATTVIQRFP